MIAKGGGEEEGARGAPSFSIKYAVDGWDEQVLGTCGNVENSFRGSLGEGGYARGKCSVKNQFGGFQRFCPNCALEQ